jgi:hypothetical protein
LLILAALGAAACGDSPTEPSSASSVTVNGNIVSFASGAAGSQNSNTSSVSSVTVPAGIRITIVGTNISVDVSGDGTFTLKNVPSGNVVLQITGPGVNATITLNDLQTGQVVTITVNVNGATAEIDSDRRSKGGEEQLEGRIESLPPTTPAGDFIVAGRTVRTTATTAFRRGDDSAGTFADLVLGYRVHVKGNTVGGVLVAREVKIQNTNTSTGLNLNGVVSGFTGTRSAFQFTVNGQLIKGDAATEFFGNSDFLELVDGARVEVKGSQRDGHVYATRIHINVEDIEFTGTITAETTPDLVFTIGGKTVKTSADTIVRRNGDEQTVSVLYVNQVVEVVGALLADGTVIARRISIVTDAPGGYFEMEGTMGGKSGTCPTLSFSVGGYQIATTGSGTPTVFDPAGSCASLSNGTKVLVKGTVQANLSVLATLVKKQ